MAKTIGIVTSGGDAPGMNAAIRAVTRVGHYKGLQVVGFERGWDGLLTNTFKRLGPRNVGGIIQSRRHLSAYSSVPRIRATLQRRNRCTNPQTKLHRCTGRNWRRWLLPRRTRIKQKKRHPSRRHPRHHRQRRLRNRRNHRI